MGRIGEFVDELNQYIVPMGLFTLNLSMNCNSSLNSFRNQKNASCGRIHTKLVHQFVDELIRLRCGWALTEQVKWLLMLLKPAHLVTSVDWSKKQEDVQAGQGAGAARN